MRLGTFHKKKKKLINLIKINFLSFFFKNRYNSSFTASELNTCLLIHDNEKIGDLIVLSALYRMLAEKQVKLYVMSAGTAHDFLKSNPHIAKFIIKKSNGFFDTLKMRKQLKKYHFDVVLDPFETFPSFNHSLLLSAFKDSYVLGFDKCYKRYYSCYDPHDEHMQEHMSTRVKNITKHLYGAEEIYDDRYDLTIPDDIEKTIKDFIGSSQVIIINPLGAKKICRLTLDQISYIDKWLKAKCPEFRIIYTGHPNDLSDVDIDNIETLPYKEFIYTVALVKYCRYVITVDTALVHIASAFDRPMLAIYPAARSQTYPSPLIWAPNNKNAIQLISSTPFVRDIGVRTLSKELNRLFSM